MVAAASEIRESSAARGKAAGGRSIARAMAEAARKPDAVLERRGPVIARERGIVGAWIGPTPRFLAGAALLVGCLAWMQQNALIPGRQIREIAGKAIETKDAGTVEGLKDLRIDLSRKTTPLKGLPAPLASLFSSFAPGVAGLILLITSSFGKTRMAVLAIAGAVVALVGPRLGIPPLGPLDGQTASMAIGGALGVVGLVVGR